VILRHLRLLSGLTCLVLLLGTTVLGSRAEDGEASSGTRVVALEVHPGRIELWTDHEYVQLLVSGRTEAGDLVDVTRRVEAGAGSLHLEVNERGLVRPLHDGQGELELRVGDLSIAIPYRVVGTAEHYRPSFLKDVMPIFSRAGCNAGGCHGSADGKKGFKLSLRGYDPAFDHAALTDDLAARRFDRVVPEQSLFLLKPTASVPHEGGQRLVPSSNDYEVLRDWAESGATFDPRAPRVASIRILPEARSIPAPGMSQQVAVVATFTDGSERDVTAHAFVETSDTETTEIDERGLVTGLRRGEAAILARYEGKYASTQLFVMGDRSAWEWIDVPEHNYVDTLVYAKLRAIKSLPSELCTDAEFVRRVYLDLTGIPPTARETRLFLLDVRAQRTKRDELIDRLIGSPDYVDYLTSKWCDLLQVNPKFLGAEGTERFQEWIKTSVASNKPYDAFVKDILSASGSTYENPAAAYYKVLREPDVVMENTTQLFLGIRFNCNKCHDHPFERWTQRDHWQLAAYFARVGRENAEGSPELAGGIAGEELISDGEEGEVKYPEKDEVALAAFPFEHAGAIPAETNLRAQLTAWLAAPENPYFARSFVNRTWSYFTGVGLIDPVDDIRAGNPPTNPQLLDRLTQEFVDSGFDVRALMRTICRSRVYQHSVGVNEWNEDDEVNFSHALARRLPAEVLFDAVHRATGAPTRLAGVRADTRAVQLVDAGVSTEDGFLELFGRPARESSCECERGSGMSLGQALNLVNGPTVAEAIGAPGGGIEELVAFEQDPRKIIEELYLSFLCRFPTEAELDLLTPSLDVEDPANRVALGPEDGAELTRRRAEWESELLPLPTWTTLVPATAVSANAATLTIQEDGSIRAEGPSAAKDVYTVVAVYPGPDPITGIRIEVLADEELASGGPGRSDSGNFVLTDLAVTAVPVGQPEATRQLVLQGATADFSQAGWPVTAAVDDNPDTGWAVMPRFGARHEAIFELEEDLSGGTLLVFTLAQNHGDQHTIGRLRVSVTQGERPVRHHGLPDDVVLALETPIDERTSEHERLLHAHFIGTQPDLAEKIRLGATQDLAWALANSPAFLFNR